MKAVTNAQVTMAPAFQVRAMALLEFKPEAGGFDTAEAEDADDDPDEEVLDLAYAVGDDAGGVVAELDGVASGVQDGDDESELGAGFVGDGDTDVVVGAGAC